MLAAVLIDSREPEWARRLTFGAASTSVGTMEYGDLWATCDDGALLVIERKSPSDLLASIQNERIWPQLAGLTALTRWAYLVVTGDLRAGVGGKAIADGRQTAWNWSSIQGAFLKAQEMGAFVVLVPTEQEYGALILRLCARERGAIPVRPARLTIWLTEGEQLLAALPGIGVEKLQALIRACGTPANVLQYLTETEGTVYAGCGPATRRAVRAALGLHDNQSLEVVITNNSEEDKHV